MARKMAIPQAVRRAVALRHGAVPGLCVPIKCFYCPMRVMASWPKRRNGKPGYWVSVRGFEFDHVVPESKGGKATAENMVLACRSCNRSKATKTSPGAI